MTHLQTDFLVQLYELIRLYEAGQWNFEKSTIWSRLLYELARGRGKLKPSPVAGRYNTTQAFEQKVHQCATVMVKRKLCTWKSTRSDANPSRSIQGYKRHRARTKDLFMTGAGVDHVRGLLRGQGRWAEDGLVSCNDLGAPRSPMASDVTGCEE